VGVIYGTQGGREGGREGGLERERGKIFTGRRAGGRARRKRKRLWWLSDVYSFIHSLPDMAKVCCFIFVGEIVADCIKVSQPSLPPSLLFLFCLVKMTPV